MGSLALFWVSQALVKSLITAVFCSVTCGPSATMALIRFKLKQTNAGAIQA